MYIAKFQNSRLTKVAYVKFSNFFLAKTPWIEKKLIRQSFTLQKFALYGIQGNLVWDNSWISSYVAEQHSILDTLM